VTYAEAIQFLFRLQLFGARFGLETTRQLAAAAGCPEQKLKFIHVAGTNGKGSTCAMLEAIYRGAGLRVGLYTSPHLVSFRERIQVNRELISEEAVVRLVGQAMSWMETVSKESPPTFFEVVTVIAMRYFADARCDLVVWETGLGGRLDATNIVTPLASVITNVQLDHEKWLGGTVAEIAREKAGIIKPGIPVVTAADDPAALAVITEVAAKEGAPLVVVSAGDLAGLPSDLALAGEHQRRNAALALRTIQVLEATLPIPDKAVEALSHVDWAGRFQVLKRGAQTIVLDGAHNPAGARALAATVRREFPGRPCTLVIGVLEDKNWAAVCQTLAPLANRIIAAAVASSRTTDPETIATVCRDTNPAAVVRSAGSLAEALQLAGEDEWVLVTGSLYFVGEAMELLGIATGHGERPLNDWARQAGGGQRS